MVDLFKNPTPTQKHRAGRLSFRQVSLIDLIAPELGTDRDKSSAVVARNSVTCYQPQEPQGISFDEHATFPITDWLHCLLAQLQSLLSTREAAVAT